MYKVKGHYMVDFQKFGQGHSWLSLSLMLVSATLLYLTFIIRVLF